MTKNEREEIRKIIEGIESHTKISVMVDVGRVNIEDVKPASESPVQMIRTAAYVKDIDKAIHMANHFHEKGYETTINIMATKPVPPTAVVHLFTGFRKFLIVSAALVAHIRKPLFMHV